MKYVRKRTGSLSPSSRESQVTGTAPRLAHSLTRVVLPNPAGAETSVKLPLIPPASRSSRRGRGTRSGRGGGRYSLVVRREVLTVVILLFRIADLTI